MFQVFRNAWMDTQLRKKILYTLFIIVLFRLGSNIFVPFLDNSAISTMMGGASLLNYLDVMTGGSLGKGTLLAMSITPYINASIIIQLLAVAIPPLEKLQKEGEEGRKKLNTITKFTSLALAILQAIAFYFTLRNGYTDSNGVHTAILKYGDVREANPDMFAVVLSAIVIVACFVAGASMIIWLGDRINEKGIGNGISMILFAGIVSGLPNAVTYFVSLCKENLANIGFVLLAIVIFIAMVWFVIMMTNAERRIPVQYSKKMVGRKLVGGQASHIPLKVNTAGVIPVIFASSIMSFPIVIAQFFHPDYTTIGGKILMVLNSSYWFRPEMPAYSVGLVIYLVLIVLFAYFYTSITFNPLEVANNMKKSGGFIPGIRPGKPTSEYLDKILNYIVFIGAIGLIIVSVIPIIISGVFTVSRLSFMGTSLIIIVSVILETIKAIESQMIVRNYKGFLND